jgi:hypothetical protein
MNTSLSNYTKTPLQNVMDIVKGNIKKVFKPIKDGLVKYGTD